MNWPIIEQIEDDTARIISTEYLSLEKELIINMETCEFCGQCVRGCPKDALVLPETRLDAPKQENTPYMAHPNLCVSCGVCSVVCSLDAIQFKLNGKLLEKITDENTSIKYLMRYNFMGDKILDIFQNKNDKVDISFKELHIGIFMQIQKVDDEILIGLSNLQSSHMYRNVLENGFVNIMKSFNLSNINQILIATPQSNDFYAYLKSLGFTENSHDMSLDIKGKQSEFLKNISKNIPKILTIKEQLKSLVLMNMPESDKNDIKVDLITKSIISKLKKQKGPNDELWSHRSKIDLKTIITSAALLDSKEAFHNHLNTSKFIISKAYESGFIETYLKLIINSFPFSERKGVIEELFGAISGDTEFHLDYIQKFIARLIVLAPEELKKIKVDSFKSWYDKNLPNWKIKEQLVQENSAKVIESNKLNLTDFGANIDEKLSSNLQNIIDYYNENIKDLYYLLETK